MRSGWVFGIALGTALAVTPALAASFVNFESGQVRPLALSPGGDLLFAVNTPDNRLAVYTVTEDGLAAAVEVPVGLEPVAVATRTNGLGRTEAWVVNHLSDSVSVVEIDPVAIEHSRVTRTLLVGDEPRDIVFAGPGHGRAFVTAAHRGQNRPGDPQLTTEGVGRADVWVFNAAALGAALGGTPLTILQLFGDTPRGLAASPDGSKVYAAVFHSGNQTTTIVENAVTANGGLPPPPPGSTSSAPPTGLIVKVDPGSGQWRDEIARNWSPFVPFSLPDQDVFTIDANATPPVQTAAVSGVGTVLFNMAVRPDNGKLYVSNTEARNQVRFEPLITGNLVQSRITVVDGTTVAPRHLNPHINYSVVPGPATEVAATLAFPTDMVFSPNGVRLFVAAFGSGTVGVLDTISLEAGAVVAGQVEVGGGPTGLAFDAAHDRLYVLNRFDQTISIVTDASLNSLRAQTAVVPLRFDPSPQIVRSGRRFLYDARGTSAHGDQACASCHIFGDFDSLSWDLGDPFGAITPNPNPFVNGVGNAFHPMKGPMTTQSLRGMADAGPMHWRGDRTGGTTGGDPLDEDLAFKAFNPAFVGLLGRPSELTDDEMQAFTDFILTVKYPPNPIRALSDVATTAQAAGESFYTTQTVDGPNTCNFCHDLPLGTAGRSSNEGLVQQMKVPHLRNAYQKVGMFGVPAGVFPTLPGGLLVGPQVRGVGFLHDGSVSSVFLFLNGAVFNFGTTPNVKRRNLEAFILALDTGLKPAVGQQVSATPSTFADAAVVGRITLLVQRHEALNCDLTVKGVVAGEARGWLYAGAGQFTSDRALEPPIAATALRALAATPGQELLYTCVPPGSGFRIALDRDKDGFRDRDELDAGSDPADETSVPGGPAFVVVQTTSFTMKDKTGPPADPGRRKLSFKASTRNDPSPNRVVAPAIGSAGDPTLGGATLTVYNSSASGEVVTIPLAAANWTRVASSTGARYTYKGPDPDGPVKKITVQADKLQVKGGKDDFAYSLDEAKQGSVAIRLQLGTTTLWCANATAKLSGSPPSPVKNDRQDRFTAARKTPPPPFCPNLPPSSPSGAFLE